MKTTPLPSVKQMEDYVPEKLIVPEGILFKMWNTDFYHILTQDRNQAYTSLVEEINKALFDNCENYIDGTRYCNGYEQACADIIENVVKPLYNKTGDN